MIYQGVGNFGGDCPVFKTGRKVTLSIEYSKIYGLSMLMGSDCVVFMPRNRIFVKAKVKVRVLLFSCAKRPAQRKKIKSKF